MRIIEEACITDEVRNEIVADVRQNDPIVSRRVNQPTSLHRMAASVRHRIAPEYSVLRICSQRQAGTL
jgi:hypothetical protein